MTAWMLHNEKENPLYSEFDYLLEIMKEHEVTLSMGNGMRAGAIHDATDRAGIQELLINAELADKAHAQDVQVIVEGPGHVPIDEIATNVQLMKRVTNNKPFYMLGPIVTDIAPGYDDRVAAIGAAISSSLGADFICYVTPAEHLALPTPEEVFEGVISSRIAAHVGDMIDPRSPGGRPRDGSRPARPRLGTPVRCRHETTARAKEIRAERYSRPIPMAARCAGTSAP